MSSWAHATVTGRATLLSEASIGGRAFLNVVPAGRTRMEPAVFICELRVRLRIPDAWCPLCNAVLHHHTHHAGMCVAGGEHIQRHHAVRELVHSWAHRAGLRSEREKAGLLLPSNPEETGQANRRPADLYLPASAGSPVALDFAIATATGDLGSGESAHWGCSRCLCSAQRTPLGHRSSVRGRGQVHAHGG